MVEELIVRLKPNVPRTGLALAVRQGVERPKGADRATSTGQRSLRPWGSSTHMV